MDWQLVARYFTVKSTDFFTVYRKKSLHIEYKRLHTSVTVKVLPILIYRKYGPGNILFTKSSGYEAIELYELEKKSNPPETTRVRQT